MIAVERLRELLPERADYAQLRTSWMRDVLAGITVGVVAVTSARAWMQRPARAGQGQQAYACEVRARPSPAGKAIT